ncbi:MAG: hypothetical protein Q8P95_05580 [bacterium]|nr:hypothetical protein [bacterium]
MGSEISPSQNPFEGIDIPTDLDEHGQRLARIIRLLTGQTNTVHALLSVPGDCPDGGKKTASARILQLLCDHFPVFICLEDRSDASLLALAYYMILTSKHGPGYPIYQAANAGPTAYLLAMSGLAEMSDDPYEKDAGSAIERYHLDQNCSPLVDTTNVEDLPRNPFDNFWKELIEVPEVRKFFQNIRRMVNNIYEKFVRRKLERDDNPNFFRAEMLVENRADFDPLAFCESVRKEFPSALVTVINADDEGDDVYYITLALEDQDQSVGNLTTSLSDIGESFGLPRQDGDEVKEKWFSIYAAPHKDEPSPAEDD